MNHKVYIELATRVTAMEHCIKRNNDAWFDKHGLVIDTVLATAPLGSGLDAGLTINLRKSRTDRLVLSTSFHHMSDTGFYAGWSEHDLVIKPSLQFGFELRITGENRNDIKDYLMDLFSFWLDAVVELGGDADVPTAVIISD
jgi:hypothetical protein